MVGDVLRTRFEGYTWGKVTEGDSGASVFHLTGRLPELFVKTAPTSTQLGADLAGEADRLRWLLGRGVPAPRIVDSACTDESTWLVTEALPGRPAAEWWPEEQRSNVVAAVARFARTLHSIPVEDCPFDRRITTAMATAADNVRKGRVDLDDLEDVYAGWTGERLLAELHRTRPSEEDLVVCHGDLTPQNVFLDVETCDVVGVIDVGRLGVADRYADLALMVRELRSLNDPWFGPECAEQFGAAYGVEELDSRKVDFFVLLDELF